MTATVLGWVTAGLCVSAFVGLWFFVSFQELSAKRKSLSAIREQVWLHQKLSMGERGGEHDRAAQNILENKRRACREVEQAYAALLNKPMNRIPGCVMGFRRAAKENEW